MTMETRPGFDQPMRLMSDCHRRIERFLHALDRMVEAARGGPLVDEQREMLEAALRYFDGMARLHTADEEESLFPRLRRRTAETRSETAHESLLAWLDGLEADHGQVDAAHREVDRLARRWLAADGLSPADLGRLDALLADLCATYRQHIQREDEQVFPAAGRLLDIDDLAAIGVEMATRRGGMTCAQRKAQQRARS